MHQDVQVPNSDPAQPQFSVTPPDAPTAPVTPVVPPPPPTEVVTSTGNIPGSGKSSNKWLFVFVVIIILILLAGVIGYFVITSQSAPTSNTNPTSQITNVTATPGTTTTSVQTSLDTTDTTVQQTIDQANNDLNQVSSANNSQDSTTGL